MKHQHSPMPSCTYPSRNLFFTTILNEFNDPKNIYLHNDEDRGIIIRYKRNYTEFSATHCTYLTTSISLDPKYLKEKMMMGRSWQTTSGSQQQQHLLMHAEWLSRCRHQVKHAYVLTCERRRPPPSHRNLDSARTYNNPIEWKQNAAKIRVAMTSQSQF